MRHFCIGDVHGHSDLLREMLRRVEKSLQEDDVMVLIGDYLDRGPDVFGTIEELVSLRERIPETVFLLGNHEQEVVRSTRSLLPFSLEMSVNDGYTIQSYLENGHDFVRGRIPESHKDFFRTLRSRYDAGELFFVHAGVSPHLPILSQNEDQYLWSRHEFLNYRRNFEKKVVHGHTPTKTGRIEDKGNRIAVDVGVYKNDRLACAVLEGQKVVEEIYVGNKWR